MNEVAALSKQISALCRKLRSRKRDDIVQRPQVEATLATLRAKRDALRNPAPVAISALEEIACASITLPDAKETARTALVQVGHYREAI
jgi:hypothetical protein